MKTIVAIIASVITSSALAGAVNIDSVTNGSGSPGNEVPENALEVFNGIMHAPQYMPGFPTAATIWPRVIEVPCSKDSNGSLHCAGYKWSPNMGRGEYLFISPKVVEPPVIPVVEEAFTPIPPKQSHVKKKKRIIAKPLKQCR